MQEFTDKMKKICDEATATLEKAQKRMSKYYNTKHKPALLFNPGDKVWLVSKDIETDRPSKKLNDMALGPYEILE